MKLNGMWVEFVVEELMGENVGNDLWFMYDL